VSSESIRITVGESAFDFELLRDAAPRTVAAVLERLPATCTAYHGFTTGMAFTMPFGEPEDACENPYAFGPLAGSLLYFPNVNRRTVDGEVSPAELVVAYGVVRFFDWTGWQPCSLIGTVVGDRRDELLAVGSAIRARGGTQVVVEAAA
jgi:hypothetical protein